MFLDFYWNFFCPRSRISPKTTELPLKFPFSGNFPPPSFVSYAGRTFPALIHPREKEHHPMQHMLKLFLRQSRTKKEQPKGRKRGIIKR